jgi:hypothetical protein
LTIKTHAMTTPPKDKPVRKDEEKLAEKDELQNDEAVAAADLETDTDSEDQDPEENSADDLNIDNTQVGLNNEQGEEFL